VVDETQQYSAAEMERMIKVQDVLLKAMAKKITWWAAAEIIGVTDRTMRRWRERPEEDGYSGLADRRKGKPSAKRIPLATVASIDPPEQAAPQSPCGAPDTSYAFGAGRRQLQNSGP
jgi:hypothetical protein